MFIYHCGDLSWSDAATIGFNAPLTAAFTHPLSTTIAGASVHISSDEIACIHHGSEWNNIILELEDSNHILETTPEPHFSTGIRNSNRTVHPYMPIIPCVSQEVVWMLVTLGAAQDFRVLYNQASVGVMPPATFSKTAVMTLMKYAQVSLIH